MANEMTATTMATYLPDVWSQLASIVYRTNVVIPDLVDRRWEPELPPGRGDIVNVPLFGQNTSASKRTTFGTLAALTWSALTDVQRQIAVNQMAYKGFVMPLEMNVQKMAMYDTLLTDGIGQACAIQVDSELAADTTNGFDGYSTVVGTDNIDITDDNILTCETNLNNANAPLEWRYLVVSPASYGSMMKIDVLRNQMYRDSVGNLAGDKGAGYRGKVYTFDVYMSNNLEAGAAGKKNAAFQREATALIMQQNLKIVEEISLSGSSGTAGAYGFAKIVAGYVVYGFLEMKDDHGNELDGK